MSTARVALRRTLLCALAFAAGTLAHRAITPIAPLDVHISGDGAAQVGAAVFTWPGPSRAADPARAAMEVVTFRRWQNVEAMTGLMAVCGAPCDGRAPVVLLRRPSLGGLTRVRFVDLSALGAGPALDRGAPMDAATIACVAALIDRHLHDRARTGTPCQQVQRIEAIRPRLLVPGALEQNASD